MKTHMPLVQKNWEQYGLKSWKVIKFPDDAAYCVQATLEWDDISSFQKAATSESAKEVMGDVRNFCDKDPTLVTGEVVGTS
jgi:uncharacterized protein (TIGR02118 family)